MVYELNYVNGVDGDLAGLDFNENMIVGLQTKLNSIVTQTRPLAHTDRVFGTDRLRKIPFNNYRVFLYIDEPNEVVYVLAVRHHNNCYKPQELRKVLTLLRKVQET